VVERMKKKKLRDDIHLVEFKTQYDITSTLVRFQEHYESPKFAGYIFTLEEFADWYTKKKGTFSYYTDWVGFNFPSHVLNEFFYGAFDPLMKKERKFLNLFTPYDYERFYVIGVYGNDHKKTGVLRHELAHALYYLDDNYRKKSDKIMRQYDTKDVQKMLRDSGYAKHVVMDEVHAYGVAGEGSKIGNMFEKMALNPMKQELCANFEGHSKGIKV
jgi:hypothetical protein